MSSTNRTRRDILRGASTILLASTVGGCLGGIIGSGNTPDPYQTPTRSPPPEYEPKVTTVGEVVFHKSGAGAGNMQILCEIPVKNLSPVPTEVISTVTPQSGEWAQDDGDQAVLGPDETATLKPGVRMLKWSEEVLFKVVVFAQLKGDSDDDAEMEMEFEETLLLG